MANKERAETEISLGGVKRRLRPCFEALCEIEDASGQGIPALLAGSQKGKLGFKAVAAILYGGMRGAGEEVTFEEVGELVRAEGLKDLILPAFRFLNQAMSPAGKPGQKEDEKEGGTGKPDPKPEA